MPDVPEAPTVLPGDIPDGTVWEELRAAIAFWASKPFAQVRATSTQTLGTGAYTSLLFGAEDFDDDPDGVGMHSTSSNTSRATPRYPGQYTGEGGAGFAASSTGLRGLRWAKNGTAINGGEIFMPPTASSTPIYTSRSVQMSMNGTTDYMELQAFHSHGSNLATVATSTDQPHMKVTFERSS